MLKKKAVSEAAAQQETGLCHLYYQTEPGHPTELAFNRIKN